MKRIVLSIAIALSTSPALAQAELKGALQPDKLVTQEPKITPPIDKEPFVGSGGFKKLGSQLIFPVRHPVITARRTTFPVRHPLVAFKRYSEWVEPYNSGLAATSSIAGTAGSAGIFGLYAKRNP